MLSALTTNNSNSRRKLWKAKDMCMVLVVAMVSQVHTYPQIDRIVYVKGVQLFICQSHSNKVIKKNHHKKPSWNTDTTVQRSWSHRREKEHPHERTKVPLSRTSTNCEHESEATLDYPTLLLSAASE